MGGRGVVSLILCGFVISETHMFDPYNKTFSWRAHRIGFVLNQRWKPSRALTSLCKVTSDDTGSRITITALKSPFYGPENQSTSAVASLSNDITIIVGDVNRSVEESSFSSVVDCV